MVKRNKDNSTFKRKISKIVLNKIKRSNMNRINNNKNNPSLIDDYILYENEFSNTINDFNEKELIKSSFSIEKNENGITVYNKINIYKNGKKITKKISMKDNKILKNSTEIIDDNNNSEISNDNNINNNSSNNIIDNRNNSNDESNINSNNNLNSNDNNRRNMENPNENNNINIEDIERKINENVNRINIFENSLNDYEERFNNFKERILNRINLIERNCIRNRINYNRTRFNPLNRNRSRLYRRRIRSRRRNEGERERSIDAETRERRENRIREDRERIRHRSREERERRRSRSREERERSYSMNFNDFQGNNENILIENNFNADNIPDIKLEDVTELNDENKICLICLEEYANNDIIKKLPCNHIFHSECLKIWLSIKPSCPTCRNDLRQNN